MEKFLHITAIRFEESDNARTYLIVDNETSQILAYFSISFKELSLENTDISKNEIKKLDGINKNAKKIKVYLIGQIAKNFNVPNNPIKLEDILMDAYGAINDAKAIIGGRVIILECENTRPLIDLYEKHNFKRLIMENNIDSLITFYINIK